ncbi:MAG: metalloregulator ArsR/SmtB family transcription factor [Tenericutes bacterium]|nr:metalloregulator ArsR/SmtB family transcription factor [Mycoplasmatota bacterium]
MKLHSNELLYGLSEFYKIFGDQTRLKILDALTNKPLCVNEISELLDMNQSAISHQLKNLRASNLVRTEKVGKNVYYSISDNHIKVILNYGIEHIMEVMQ